MQTYETISVPSELAEWFKYFVDRKWYGGLTIHFKNGNPEWVEPKVSKKCAGATDDVKWRS